MLRNILRLSNGAVQCSPYLSSFPVPLSPVTRNFVLNSPCLQDAAPPAKTTTSEESTPDVTEELDKLYKTVELEMRAYEPAVLKSYSWFATTAAKELGIKVGNCWAVRKPDHDRYTVLKSIHIYKKHRVQYEVRTYFRFAQFHCLTSSTADTFLEYIERNLPEGVGMKVTKVEMVQLPGHIKAPSRPQLEK